MIFDTHTHLNVEEFLGREEEELALAAEMGVTRMNIDISRHKGIVIGNSRNFSKSCCNETHTKSQRRNNKNVINIQWNKSDY